MRVRHPEISIRPDSQPDRFTQLPLRHLPFVEILALVIEMLNARHAIDNEEGVVRFFVRDSARINHLIRPGPRLAPDRFRLAGLATTRENQKDHAPMTNQ